MALVAMAFAGCAASDAEAEVPWALTVENTGEVRVHVMATVEVDGETQVAADLFLAAGAPETWEGNGVDWVSFEIVASMESERPVNPVTFTDRAHVSVELDGCTAGVHYVVEVEAYRS